MEKHDRLRLQHMPEYCREIQQFIKAIGCTFENFCANTMALRAVSMDVLQIGELAGQLTDGCRQMMSDSIPWREIRATRNYIVHAYSRLDKEELWQTVHQDIPVLRAQLECVLRNRSTSELPE